MTTKQEIAAQLATIHGLRVFPVSHGGHQPAVKFSSQSSTSLDRIKKWWRTDGREIGIHTGEGVFVLDVDLQHDGIATLDNLIHEHGDLPPTLTVRTPSGGKHYYFKSSKDIRNSASKVGQGLDIRGHNGYVVGPGSERAPNGSKPHGRYILDTGIDTPIADAPDWLEQLALRPSRPIDPTPEFTPTEAPQRGERNTTLFKEACMLRGKGWAEPLILEAMQARNKSLKPPLKDREVKTLVAQAAKYAPNTVPALHIVPDPQQSLPDFIKPLTEYESRDVFYLWGNYFPRAAVSIVAGNPGQKKTAFMLTLAAAITTGRDLYPGSGALPQGSVMLATSEDSIEHTIRTRFDAANGDLNHFYVLPSSLNFDSQFEQLDNAMTQLGDVRLMIIDPITAYMRSGADGNSNTDVRTLMRAVHELATNHNTAVVGISHLTKDQSKSVWARLLGSIAWNAAARAVYMIGENPDDIAQSVVACVKTNYVEPPMMQFDVSTAVVETTTGNKEEMKLDVSPYRGELGIEEVFEPRKLTRKDYIASWLRRRLSGGKLVLAKTIEVEAKQKGYSWPSVQKVSVEEGVEKHRSGKSTGNRYYWCLPGAMLPGPTEMTAEEFEEVTTPVKKRRAKASGVPSRDQTPDPDTSDTDR